MFTDESIVAANIRVIAGNILVVAPPNLFVLFLINSDARIVLAFHALQGTLIGIYARFVFIDLRAYGLNLCLQILKPCLVGRDFCLQCLTFTAIGTRRYALTEGGGLWSFLCR